MYIKNIILIIAIFFSAFSYASGLNFVIFGGAGDLSTRKIFPSLYNLHVNNMLPEHTNLIGVDIKNIDIKEYRQIIKKSLEKNNIDCTENKKCEVFLNKINYLSDNMKDSSHLKLLYDLAESNNNSQNIYFLSVSFKIFSNIITSLGENNLIKNNSKIIVEKPFGDSLKSSVKIHNVLNKFFKEEQIYRIDHYLGKPLVQSILALRFNNPILEKNWDRNSIESIEINAFEELGLEGRAWYYDQVGALKDMVQSHLLQLMSLLAMDKPETIIAKDIRKSKVEIINKIVPITKKTFSRDVVFGQYKGYNFEDGVDKNTKTDTFVKIRAFIDSDRWRGVPFILATGKKMGDKKTEIKINFKKNKQGYSNSAYLEIDPSTSIKLSLNVFSPNKKNNNEVTWLLLDKKSNINKWKLKGYDKLIFDVIVGDNELFVTRSEVEESWKWVDNIINIKNELNIYPKIYDEPKKEPKVIDEKIQIKFL